MQQQARAASSKGGIAGLWSSLFGNKEPQESVTRTEYVRMLEQKFDATIAGRTCLKPCLPLQGPTAAEKEVQALRQDLQAVNERLSDGARQLRFQHK